MRARATFLMIIGLLFLIGIVTASLELPTEVITVTSGGPIGSTITTSKDWVIANNVDTSVITVTVINTSTSNPLNNATVTFTLTNTPTGLLQSPTTVTTDAAGNALCTFQVKTNNGVARIKAEITYVDPISGQVNTAVNYIDQKIDHDSPYIPIFYNAGTGTVKTEVPVIITFTDLWGNLIDSRNPAEIHSTSFHVHGPSPDDCGFSEAGLYPHDVSKTLDSHGNVSLIVNLTSTAGSNNMLVDRFGSMPDKMRSIVAISNSEPFYIEQTFDPDGFPYASVIADGSQTFTLSYKLYDRFWNPTVGQPLNLTTSAPEYYPDRLTSANGDVWYTYGPKSFTGIYTLTATAVNNRSVTISKDVRFYNNSPSNVEIYASPQSMPSRDANPDIYSTITAKVVDILGNPVAGENVTFTIHSVTYTPGTVGYNKTPSFSSSANELIAYGITGSDGTASVRFYPSYFSLYGEPGYEQSATGTGTVTATWSGVQRDVGLVWKNYPYLSAEMETACDQKQIGDIIDVHLKLNGDGWALKNKPIDVVLATDRSGSMAGTKITDAKNAAVLFTNNLTTQDNEGLVSFGGSNATSDQALTNSKLTLTTKINTYAASGNTPMRDALYRSGYIIKNTARTNSVRAVILLTDGEWNQMGNPLGPPPTDGTQYPVAMGDGVGTGSVVNYIRDNNMRLYIIGLGVTPTYRAVLEGYVNTVGGGSKYYHAPSSSELAGIYTDIAGQLRESAGVDTVAVMDFGSIVVNDQMDTSGNVFAYVADPGTAGVISGSAGTPPHMYGSTMVRKYNQTHDLIPGPDYTQVGPLIDNMTGYWNTHTPHQLYFNIGEVKLNQSWETNFQVRVLKEGSISLMGPASQITFRDVNGDLSSMLLNNLSTCSIAQNAQFTGATWQTITITDFKRTDTPTGNGPVGTTLPITWTTDYTGLRPVTHDVLFIHDNDPPVRFDQYVTTGGGERTLYSQLDMSRLPPGGYQIRIHAYADDADAVDTIGPWAYNTQTRAFIKLE